MLNSVMHLCTGGRHNGAWVNKGLINPQGIRIPSLVQSYGVPSWCRVRDPIVNVYKLRLILYVRDPVNGISDGLSADGFFPCGVSFFCSGLMASRCFADLRRINIYCNYPNLHVSQTVSRARWRRCSSRRRLAAAASLPFRLCLPAQASSSQAALNAVAAHCWAQDPLFA